MTSSLPPPTLFRSFFQGGFEAATHINRHGERLDMIATTQHDRHVVSDYALLRSLELRTARDAFRWPSIEQNGRYNFASFAPMERRGKLAGSILTTGPTNTICHSGRAFAIASINPRSIRSSITP